MNTDFWLERWEQGQIGFHERDINNHLQKFWDSSNIQASSHVFIPLCGKSKDILWLLSEGYQVTGVELSPIAVKSFFTENKLTPRITETENFTCWQADGLNIYLGNFFDLNHKHLHDCLAVYDRAALIALPPEMRSLYVQHLNKIAPGLKHSLLISLEYAQQEMQGPPFSVEENEIYRLFAHTHDIENLSREDILSSNENFQQKGLSQLVEKVYRLNKY